MQSRAFCQSTGFQWLPLYYFPYVYPVEYYYPQTQYSLQIVYPQQTQLQPNFKKSAVSAFSEYQEQIAQKQTETLQTLGSTLISSSKTIISSIHNLQKQQQSNISLYQANFKQKKNISRNQKEGRNKISNIMRTFFKFIHERTNVNAPLKRIIGKGKLQIKEEQFFQWFNKCCPDYRNYIRPITAKKLFSDAMSPKICVKIMRCLLKYFVNKIYPLYLFNSGKMNKRSWTMHLKGSKELISLMLSS